VKGEEEEEGEKKKERRDGPSIALPIFSASGPAEVHPGTWGSVRSTCTGL
jgi:hypothetical protein